MTVSDTATSDNPASTGLGRHARRARPRRQALRRAARPARHQRQDQARRGRRRHRPVRLGQVDAVPHHQPARDDRQRHHQPERRPAAGGGQGARRAARRGRDGVPELQPLRPQDDPRERHARAGQGAQDAHESAEELGQAQLEGRRAPAGRQVPRPALRRPAAARGHRPRAGDGAPADALRRTHVGAGPRDDQGGPRRDGRPRQAGGGRADDDGRGDPRDGLRPDRRRPGALHGRRPDRRGEHPRGVLHQPAQRAGPRTSSARSSSTEALTRRPPTTASHTNRGRETGGRRRTNAIHQDKGPAVAGLALSLAACGDAGDDDSEGVDVEVAEDAADEFDDGTA